MAFGFFEIGFIKGRMVILISGRRSDLRLVIKGGLGNINDRSINPQDIRLIPNPEVLQ